MGLERARIRRSSLDRMARAMSAGFKLRTRGRGGGDGEGAMHGANLKATATTKSCSQPKRPRLVRCRDESVLPLDSVPGPPECRAAGAACAGPFGL